MRVSMASVIENKYSYEVYHKAKNWHKQQSLMVYIWRSQRSLENTQYKETALIKFPIETAGNVMQY